MFLALLCHEIFVLCLNNLVPVLSFRGHRLAHASNTLGFIFLLFLALKRAVSQLADGLEYSSSADDDAKSIAGSSTSTRPNIMDCLVTQDDFYEAIQDVRKDRSGTNRDYADDDDRDHNDEDNNTVSTVQRNGREGFRTRLKQKIRDWVLS